MFIRRFFHTGVILMMGPCALAAPGVDVEALVAEARRVQEADIRAWSRYSFQRLVRKNSIDSNGADTVREESVSLITPLDDGRTFDERLIGLNGSEPPSAQVRAHRKDAPFTRHYGTLSAGDGEEETGGYSLAYLLRMSTYHYVGIETLNGVECHRLSFEPDPEYEAEGTAGRFARVMAGDLWITAEGSHLIRASARSVEPVNLTLAIVRVTSLQVEMKTHRVGPDVWLPRRIDMRVFVKILGFPLRRHYTYEYSGFNPHPSPEGKETRETDPADPR